MDGLTYPTTEHYFQAMKFPAREDHREKIRTAPTPKAAKELGQTPEGFHPEWAKIKDEVMYKALLAKFTQHPKLRQELDATGSALLVENSRDDYWGDGLDGGTGEKGKNVLGKLLVRVRDELRRVSKV